MTRRELFALLPAAAMRSGASARPPFERIDAHLHIRRSAPALFEAIEKAQWRCLTICVSSPIGDEPSVVEAEIEQAMTVHKASKGRVAWATTFDARGFDSPGFADRAIEVIHRSLDQGAIAVKIWKNMGMGIKASSGEWVLSDNPAYDPIYEAIRKSGRPMIAHLAEPDAAWQPLDANNRELGYYRSHPEWHMLGKQGAPAKDVILAARDRILARHPKLKVIGAHLGSDEEHWNRLARRLDRFPNFAVDMAARIRYFVRGDREQARQFLLKYQDRVLYATDFVLEDRDDAAAGRSLQRTWDRDWEFFASSDVIESPRGAYRGLGLPESVVRKLFRDNAVRWLPGITGA